MSEEALAELRRRADDLEPGAEALELYGEILELDPDDVGAANMIGRSLQALGDVAGARSHWAMIVELQPDNAIASRRLADLRHAPLRPTRSVAPRDRPVRDPREIVEPVIAGPGRDACICALADAILLVERLDASRLAVTDRPSDNRFRVSGGKTTLVTPWQGMLCFFLHRPAVDDELEARIFRTGGKVTYRARDLLKSVPDAVEYGVPFAAVGEVAENLKAPLREQLLRSLAAGPPPSGHLHDPALRDYIVENAAALRDPEL